MKGRYGVCEGGRCGVWERKVECERVLQDGTYCACAVPGSVADWRISTCCQTRERHIQLCWHLVLCEPPPHITPHHHTSLHHTSLHHTSPHITTPHITTPHITTHHYTTHHHTSLHHTSLHHTSAHITTPPHITTPNITPHHHTLRQQLPHVCAYRVVAKETVRWSVPSALRTRCGGALCWLQVSRPVGTC